jgi:hypothetical protein
MRNESLFHLYFVLVRIWFRAKAPKKSLGLRGPAARAILLDCMETRNSAMPLPLLMLTAEVVAAQTIKKMYTVVFVRQRESGSSYGRRQTLISQSAFRESEAGGAAIGEKILEPLFRLSN